MFHMVSQPHQQNDAKDLRTSDRHVDTGREYAPATQSDSNSDSMINLRRKLDQADLERLSMLHPYHPTHFRVAGHAFVDRALEALDAKTQQEKHRYDANQKSRPTLPQSGKDGHQDALFNDASRPLGPPSTPGGHQRWRLGRVECSQTSLWALRPGEAQVDPAAALPLMTRDQVSDIIARHSTRTWAVGRSSSPSPIRHHRGSGKSRSQSPTNRKRYSSPERFYGSNPRISSFRVPLPYRLYMIHLDNEADEEAVAQDDSNTHSPPIDVERLIQVAAKSFPRDPLDPVYPVRQHISFGTDGMTPRPDTRSGRYHLLKKGLRPASASAIPPRQEQVVAAQAAKRDKFIRAVSACVRKGRSHSTAACPAGPTSPTPVPSSVTSSRIGSASVSNRPTTAQRRPSTGASDRKPAVGPVVSSTTQSKKGQPTVAQLRDRVKRVLSAGPHIVPSLPVPETLSDWSPPWRNRPQTPPPSGQGVSSAFKSAAAADEVFLRIPEPAASVASAGANSGGAKAAKATGGVKKRSGNRVEGKVGETVDVFKGLVLPSIGLGVDVDGGSSGTTKTKGKSDR